MQDNTYESKIILIDHGREPFAIVHGDRIDQRVLAPVTWAACSKVDALDETARGRGGFGSTGRG